MTVPREQLPLGRERHRAVGGLDDERGADAGRVGLGDLALDGGWNQNVALRLERGRTVGDEARAGEAPDAARAGQVLGQGRRRETGIGENGAIVLDDADEAHAFFLGEASGGVEAHIAEALDDHAFALEATLQASAGHVVRVAEELAQHVLHAAAGRLHAARNTALGHRLPCDAGQRVDILGIELAVLVRHPGHLARAGADVGRGHVPARADVAAIGKLPREAARDLLELLLRVVVGADRKPALGATEGHVDERALEGHQRRQRLDLLLVDEGRVANAALHGQPVLAVHRAPAAEGPVLPAQAHREAKLDDRLALADGLHEVGRDIERASGAVEHPAHAGLEIGLGRGPHGLLRCRMKRSWRSNSICSRGDVLARVSGLSDSMPNRSVVKRQCGARMHHGSWPGRRAACRSGPAAKTHRHARTCSGHPRSLYQPHRQTVDGRDKPDGVDAPSRRHRNVPRWRCRQPPEGGGIHGRG